VFSCATLQILSVLALLALHFFGHVTFHLKPTRDNPYIYGYFISFLII